MTTTPRSDLALLQDDEGNSVRITVLGPLPGVPHGLAAEIVVGTPFVSGRVQLALWQSRLTAWAEALYRLEAGESITWLGTERGPSLSIRPVGERDVPDVIIEDALVSMTTVRVPIDLPPGWIPTHRKLLGDVLTRWADHLHRPARN